MQTALLGDFDTATMLGVVRETPRAKTFLRDRFVGANLRPVATLDVALDFVKENRAMAPIVSRNANGTLAEKPSVLVGKYRPPKVAPLGIFSSDEAFSRAPGEPFGGNMSADERAMEYAAQELLRHERLIVRRWEWMLACLLSTGQIVIDGEGVSDVLDLDHTLTETLAGDALWTGNAADILGDLDEWTDAIIESSGLTPDTLVLGKNAARAFMANDKIRLLLDSRNINIGRIDPTTVPNGAVYMGTINGIDIYRYPEWYRHDTTGVSTPMIPVNMAILGCSSTVNPDQRMVFAAHYEVEEGVVYEETMIPRVWVDKAKNARFLEIVSYPVPILPNVGGWFRATVTTG